MKQVLIVTTNKYPQGDAGAIREETFALLFRKLGFNVLVVGLGESTDFTKKKLNDIEYISLRSKKSDLVARYLNRAMYTKRLKKYAFSSETDYDIILFSSGSRNTISFLKKYQETNHRVLLHDSVEWYSPEEFKYGKLSRAYRNNNELNTKLIDKNFRVISISTYLEEHFKIRGIKTERIPVILDIENINHKKVLDENKVVFLYAGMPGKKDFLSEIVLAFSKLTADEKNKCELRIIGVTKEQLIKDCGISIETINNADECLKCLGRVSRSEVLNHLGKADFTVLLRMANQRYAQAGFPTKFVESLATGTPVVCNLSSDIGMYLQDGINGFVCDSCSSDAMLSNIRRCIGLTFNERLKMQENARNTAETYFDYRKYGQEMRALISE